jgi:hypothetical protein
VKSKTGKTAEQSVRTNNQDYRFRNRKFGIISKKKERENKISPQMTDITERKKQLLHF